MTNLRNSWNSTIFLSTPIYSYTAAFATEDYRRKNDSWGTEKLNRIRQESMTTYEELDNSDCIDRYINRLNGGKDVVVITNKSSSQNHNSTLLGSFDLRKFPKDGFWICASPYIGFKAGDGGCTKWFMNQFRTNWTVVYNGESRYVPGDRDAVLALSCYSGGVHTEDNKCGLHFSTSIMIFVCALNLIKCLLICWTRYYVRNSELLVIPGDAIVSFLQTPDVHTEDMSTKSKDDFQKRSHWSSEPKRWNPQKTRYYRAAGLRRWVATLIM